LINTQRGRTRRRLPRSFSFPRPDGAENVEELTTMTDQHAQSVALFRYGLIADLAQLKPGTGLYARIREKAAAEHTIPGTTRTRVAAETIRDWLKRYRRGGFDALVPRRRADRGRARSIPEPVAELLCSLKEQ